MFELATAGLVELAKGAIASVATGVVGNITDRQLCDITRELKERIPGLTGMPTEQDAARAFRIAQLEALTRLISEFAKEGRPEWRADPAARPQVFIDKACAFTRDCLPLVGNIKLDEAFARRLAAALDAALLSPRDGPPGERLRGLRTAAEDAVLQELEEAVAPVRVPDSFVSRFRKGDECGKGGWFDLFSAFLAEQIKTNQPLRDILFATEFSTIKQMIVDLGPRPPLCLRREKLRKANRFYFGAERAAFAGREDELARLDAFLASDRSFTWWLMGGAGGTGKSRLALQFCSRHSARWHAGFLGEAVFPWGQWRPEVPTLVVIDYAGGRAKDVGQIVRTLRDREEIGALNCPVRLLLLERTAEGPWLDRFLESGSGRHRTEGARFAEPLMLAEQLADGQLAAIGRAYGATLPGAAEEQAFTEKLREIDPAARPLFAALLGDALAAGRTPHELDREALIRDALEREDEKFWRPAGVTEADRNLLALATMTGGVAVSALPILGSQGLLPSDDDYDPPRFEAMTGRDSTDTVSPLEPDLIGELFVLELLNPIKHRRPADRKSAEMLRRLAWANAPAGMAFFLLRTHQDYPGHAALQPLRAVANDNEEQRLWWSMAASDVIPSLNTNGDVDGACETYDELKAIARAHPKEPSLCETQAAAAGHLILALHTARPVEMALDVYDDLRVLAGEHGDNPFLRSEMSKAAVNLISDLGEAKKFEAAQGVYDELKGLASAHADEPALREWQASGGVNLISALGKAREFDSAQGVYDELKALADDHPTEPALRELQAKGAVNLICELGEAGEFDAARDLYEHLTVLASAHVGEPAFRECQAEGAVGLLAFSTYAANAVDEELVREVIPNAAVRDAVLTRLNELLSNTGVFHEDPLLSALRGAVSRLFC